MTSGGIRLAPPDRANSWKQAQPVTEQDEDEDARKKPERPHHQIPSYNALKEVSQSLYQPFPEVLCTRRDLLNVPSGKLRKNDDEQRDDPCNHHRAGNMQRTEVANFGCGLR